MESGSTPGVYFVYQHLEAATVTVKPGESIKRGQKLGYIWGDNRWGHLHFGVIAWGDTPRYENRYRNSVPAFPMLYELLGYGWLLGDWCPASKVEPIEGNDQYSSALLRKRLFRGTRSEAVNPEDYFDFEIAVPNGRYAVNLLLGDVNHPTWQRVEVEGVSLGSHELSASQLNWTRERIAGVTDGRLTIRIYLKDGATYAAPSEVLFNFMDRR